MKVIVLAANDSDNLMISNVLYELERRGHELKIFSLHQDPKTFRMFMGLKARIFRMNALTKREIDWADCIFRAHSLIGLPFLGESIISDKYMYIYSTYIENHWATAGGDFMFTCGTSRHPIHEEDCPSMPIGCPKNDHFSAKEINQEESEKTFLFIDSGHFPFSHNGKIQVADLLLKICKVYPDYKLVVKPRFLLKDRNMNHANLDHIYTILEERCEGELPKNLVLLQEHRDMQELLDECCCAIMLCTSAYIDAALRGRNMIVIKGLENEDKYDLRNDIEYKNSYELREKSGCVVDYDKVLEYLPHGIKCSEEHLNEVVAYQTNASGRIVDVMEHIYAKFLSKGLFPAIKKYSYETYQEEMTPDLALTWDSVKCKRIKNIGNAKTNLFNRVTAEIDYNRFFEWIDNAYVNYPMTLEGIKSYIEDSERLIWKIWIDNKEKMMKDPVNQEQYFRALYKMGQYADLYNIPQEDVLCVGAWNYYIGMIYYQNQNYEKSMKYFQVYLHNLFKKKFAKYECEEWGGIKTAYCCIAYGYDKGDIDEKNFAEFYEELHARRNESYIPYKERKKLYQIATKVCRNLFSQGEYELAAKCALRCMEQSRAFNEERKRVDVLQRDINIIKKSTWYRIGYCVSYFPKKVLWWADFANKNGYRYTCKYVLDKIKNKIKKLHVYRIWDVFHRKVLKGYKLYADVIKKYGMDTELILSAPSTGDPYIHGMFFDTYVKAKYPNKLSVFGVLGKGGVTVGKLFGIESSIPFTMEEMQALYNLEMFLPQESMQMDLMHYHIFYRHIAILAWIEGIHGLNLFTETMEYLNISSEDLAKKPRFDYDEKFLVDAFNEIGCVPGKTVILSPYAKSVRRIPATFWERLAENLIEQGLYVCTNSCSSEEPPVLGTTAVFVPYDKSVPFIEKAGAVVGIRSGFLDVVSSADCLKFSLCSENDFKRSEVCHISQSYSLTEMYGEPEQYELLYSFENENRLVDLIVKQITEKLV